MEYLSEIISLLIGAAGGSLITWRVTKNSISGKGSIVNQNHAKAGRDVVGGNKG